MKLSIGGICCHDWTDEPEYPIAPKSPYALECTCDPKCKVSYANDPETKLSYAWQACTF